jgi:hypothetical protein
MIRLLLAFGIAASIAPAVFTQSAPPAQGAVTPPELVAYPDLALINGQVLTVDAQFAIAEAVAVRDGRMYADLVVLNGDYLAVPDEELDRLQPVIAIVGGEVVFEDSRSTNQPLSSSLLLQAGVLHGRW